MLHFRSSCPFKPKYVCKCEIYKQSKRLSRTQNNSFQKSYKLKELHYAFVEILSCRPYPYSVVGYNLIPVIFSSAEAVLQDCWV